MRRIGAVSSKTQAEVLGAYLLYRGYDNSVEPLEDGASYLFWIHDDAHIDEASGIMAAFLADPDGAVFLSGAEEGTRKLQEEAAKEELFRKNYYDRSHVFTGTRFGVVTVFLIAVSVIFAGLTSLGKDPSWTNQLLITARNASGTLSEIRAGEVWRFVTPIFLHFSYLHLIFNMMWMSDLGNVLERRHGSLKFLFFVVLIAVPSNLLQFVVSGPSFGGMSGVVYGLLGFLWLRAKMDPHYELRLRPQTVTMMGIWFVVCFLVPMLNIANTVHSVGLGVGMAAGYLTGLLSRSRRSGQ